MTIRIIHSSEPDSPASDQHPDAVRHQIGAYWVDAIGAAPTLEEVETCLGLRPTVSRVKAEARRRILARFPEWKQANMTARGVELVNIRLAVGSWTENQAQEAAALSAAWDWIKGVRAASDALEALDPIPADFADDGNWPETE
jgi:hypothetical protein